MEDSSIIELFIKRSEDAISETDKKYRLFCRRIAYSILRDYGEADECLNDTYLKMWKNIPPQIPVVFKNFIARITRNTALHLYEKKHRIKRGADTVELALSEIAECVDMKSDVEAESDRTEMENAITDFLDSLESDRRVVFVLRYWHFMSVKEIAEKRCISESNVKTSLHRTRKQLKAFLEERDLY